MMNFQKYKFKILFLNQVTGPLFRELAEDVARKIGSCAILSGHLRESRFKKNANLEIICGPDYIRLNRITRIYSWFFYFLKAFWLSVRCSNKTVLFIVSNPPFLPLIGSVLKVVRGQPYVVLIYDVYPNVLENLCRIRRNGWIANAWRFFNRLAWSHAECIFTIGDYMAANVKKMLPSNHSREVIVVPNWADTEFIKPLDKQNNDFAINLGIVGKTTIGYSGNLGLTHDIDSILEAAKRLHQLSAITFLIIGAGAKWPYVNAIVERDKLTNVKLMPFQPEERLPFTLTAIDVGIVSVDEGVEGCSIPSKIPYFLAAGAALLIIAKAPCEAIDIVHKYRCGISVAPGDVDGLTAAIEKLIQNRNLLDKMKKNARRAAMAGFSRLNTNLYFQALQSYFKL